MSLYTGLTRPVVDLVTVANSSLNTISDCSNLILDAVDFQNCAFFLAKDFAFASVLPNFLRKLAPLVFERKSLDIIKHDRKNVSVKENLRDETLYNLENSGMDRKLVVIRNWNGRWLMRTARKPPKRNNY